MDREIKIPSTKFCANASASASASSSITNLTWTAWD